MVSKLEKMTNTEVADRLRATQVKTAEAKAGLWNSLYIIAILVTTALIGFVLLGILLAITEAFRAIT